MKLAAYLEEQNLTPAQFAARMGMPASTVSRILNGSRKTPRLETIAKISDATAGEVSVHDFIDQAPRPEQGQAA